MKLKTILMGAVALSALTACQPEASNTATAATEVVAETRTAGLDTGIPPRLREIHAR